MADEKHDDEKLISDVEGYLKKQKDQVTPEERLEEDEAAPTGDKADEWLRVDEKLGEQGIPISNIDALIGIEGVTEYDVRNELNKATALILSRDNAKVGLEVTAAGLTPFLNPGLTPFLNQGVIEEFLRSIGSEDGTSKSMLELDPYQFAVRGEFNKANVVLRRKIRQIREALQVLTTDPNYNGEIEMEGFVSWGKDRREPNPEVTKKQYREEMSGKSQYLTGTRADYFGGRDQIPIDRKIARIALLNLLGFSLDDDCVVTDPIVGAYSRKYIPTADYSPAPSPEPWLEVEDSIKLYQSPKDPRIFFKTTFDTGRRLSDKSIATGGVLESLVIAAPDPGKK